MAVPRPPPPGHRQPLHEGVPMKLFFLLLLFSFLTFSPIAARAQSADEVLAALGSGNYDQIRHGVEQLAFSGDPRALAIISALQNGKLYARADHVLFIKQDDGSFVDAATAKPAPDVMASGVKQVRMNNPVRGAVDAALGSLQLFAGD